MYQAGLGMICIQSLLRPSPAQRYITEEPGSSRLRSPGSCVNRLLAGGRLRGREERISQSICPLSLLKGYLLVAAASPLWNQHLLRQSTLPPTSCRCSQAYGPLQHRLLHLSLHPRGDSGFLP